MIVPNPQSLPAVIRLVEFNFAAIRFQWPLVIVVLDDRSDSFPADADDNFSSRAINSHPRVLAIPMPDAANAITSPMLKTGGEGKHRAGGKCRE